MFDAFFHHEQFAFLYRDFMVPKANLHLALDHDEGLVGVVMVVPNKVALKLDELELVVVEFGDDLGQRR